MTELLSDRRTARLRLRRVEDGFVTYAI